MAVVKHDIYAVEWREDTEWECTCGAVFGHSLNKARQHLMHPMGQP